MNSESKKKNFNDLIHDEMPVLVDFYADWCGPCHAMAPVIKDVAEKFKGQVKVIKIDVDKNPAVSAKYSIRGIPTVILFHKGNILWQQAGLLSRADLEQHINRHIAHLN